MSSSTAAGPAALSSFLHSPAKSKAKADEMCQNPNPNPNPSRSREEYRDRRKQAQAEELASRLSRDDHATRVQAAVEIRRLARASSNNRSILAIESVIRPLVAMLPSTDPETQEAAILALLNLAVRNERNKENIVTLGAVPHLVELLRSDNIPIRELAAAAILTLSASTTNKPTIATSGAVPLLVQILISGSIQSKVDAITALYNLSTCKENSNLNLSAEAVKPLLTLLKESKKYSKFAEKATALLQILSGSEEARHLISETEGGILVLVETVEEGSLLSTECAVGVLLSLCRSSRCKYRELILGEGAIPGLLLLTAQGTEKAQERARELLGLLREDSRPERVPSGDLDSIVYDIASQVDGPNEAGETAKRILQDMVRLNSEQSAIDRLQHRAA